MKKIIFALLLALTSTTAANAQSWTDLGKTVGFEKLPLVSQAYLVTYYQACGLDHLLGEKDALKEISPITSIMTYQSKHDEKPQTLKLHQFVCMRGAYNFLSVFFQERDNELTPLHFADPIIDTEKKAITGFSSTHYLVNVSIDTKAKTIGAFSKHRGMGDAYSRYTYTLNPEGRFVLTEFEQDSTLDGEMNPTIFYPKKSK